MPSSIVNFRPVLVALLVLVPAGWLLRWAERPLIRPRTPIAEQWRALAGQGGLSVMFGGARSVVAGGFWLRANLAWERRDAAATRRLLDLTVAADERPAYFWLNGARMLAYDVPAWMPVHRSDAAHRAEIHRWAGEALGFLEKGLQWRGADPELLIEMANIHWHRREDLESAAHFYRLAAGQPGAPYYAARIHGDLLLKLGRPREALAWLQSVLPGLPPGDPAARREVVAARIDDLERTLAGR
jgi:hypothetical protein